jgi:hypothetical protein
MSLIASLLTSYLISIGLNASSASRTPSPFIIPRTSTAHKTHRVLPPASNQTSSLTFVSLDASPREPPVVRNKVRLFKQTDSLPRKLSLSDQFSRLQSLPSSQRPSSLPQISSIDGNELQESAASSSAIISQVQIVATGTGSLSLSYARPFDSLYPLPAMVVYKRAS